MLVLGTQLIGAPIMSLQVGDKIAQTRRPIVDPHDLSIIAYEVEGAHLDQQPSFVCIADIRELSSLGIIVDSSDELVGKDDVIKLKELYALDFTPIGKLVREAKSRKKLGKVVDYTVDTDTFVIQQLTIQGGFLASLSSTGHVVHRSQIDEINDTEIIVRDADIRLPSLETTGEIHRTYSNPFRQTGEPQPEASSTD